MEEWWVSLGGQVSLGVTWLGRVAVGSQPTPRSGQGGGDHQKPLCVAFHSHTALNSNICLLATSPAIDKLHGVTKCPCLSHSPSSKSCNKSFKNNCNNFPGLKKRLSEHKRSIGKRQSQHLTPSHLEIKCTLNEGCLCYRVYV